MIICESNGDLVLELIYNVVRIAMDKFLRLMIPDLTPRRASRTPPNENENEIRSPSWYLLRSNSRRFYQRKSLQFETIMEMSENQTDLEVSGIDSTQEENKSNSSFHQDSEEFKIYMIHQRAIHSSPKLVNSHFEDSGFLNCSIEMTSRLETISEILSPREEKSLGDEVSFDSYLHEVKGENSNFWLKNVEDSQPDMNRNFIAELSDQGNQEYSGKYSPCSKPFNDEIIAEIINVHDSANSIEKCQARNRSTTIADNVVSDYDATDTKFDDIKSYTN